MLDVCVRCASSCNSECHVLNLNLNWSLVIAVVLAIGDQIVEAYSRIGLVMAL